MMETRVGVIGIVIEDRENAAPKVNDILSHYAETIVGRMGLPYKERGVSVIALVVDGTADVIGAMSGKLGGIPGVKVKVALTGK
jgi:putative iron-only hydrogenase system regulator